MAKNGHHVVPALRGGWAVRQSGASRATKTFETQADAIVYARDRAEKTHGELYVHRRDGTIRDRASFGSHQQPPAEKR